VKSILFFIESLDGGGAEGVLENVVTAMDKSKFDIHVVSETDKEFRTAQIKANSRHHCFVHKNIKGSKLRGLINKGIIKYSLVAPPYMVRDTLVRGKYDIEVAFCEGYATKIIGASKDKRSKKVAWVHTDFINNPWSESIFGSAQAEKECYESFDAIICVSETIRDSFIKKYGMAEKVHIIYNIINDKRALEKSKEHLTLNIERRPLFILAGSFRKVKGYDRMVRICAKLRDLGYSFSVIIMGIGYERDEIEELLDEYKMRDIFTLMDYQANPYQYMANADAYVCSSRAEGYSTVVTEAVLLGLPVITTECSGMREIFGENECGIICDNSEDGLFDALKKVLDEPSLLERFSAEEKIRAKDFSMEKQIKNVEAFFEEM
jgi:glycosyltransferase involved in cell wall biosynthesis